jgi:aminoglycoside 2'-N-acetyltransferase I
MNGELQLEVCEGQNMSADERRNIIAFCSRAFEEDLEALFNTFSQPTHILGYQSGKLVSHALWVTRWLQVDHDRLFRTAYVEAVATEKAYRGRSYASKIMRRVEEEIQDYELGALSPFNVPFYERLVWELWRGPLYIRTEAELIRSPIDEEVMILRLPKTPELDLSVPLSAEWREGKLW